MEDLPLLHLCEVNKAFDGVQALTGLDMDILQGEIHAVVGENGAGKSTMVKLITGLLRPDAGDIRLLGQPIQGKSPRERLSMGLGVVYQDPTIFPDLSILENVFMGNFGEGRVRWMIPWSSMRDKLLQILGDLGVPLEPNALANSLSSEGLCIVGVARALIHAPRLLLMDEPTASLDKSEGERLFSVIHRLREQGVGILYISHRLEEIFQLADRVTVLRDGQRISTRAISETKPALLVREMVGRDVQERDAPSSSTQEEPLLKVKDLCTSTGLQGVSFEVKKGEILGLAGLVGSGRTRVMRALFGLDRMVSGSVQLEAVPIRVKYPWRAISFGIALVPEERATEGLALDHPTWFNMVSAILHRITRFGVIRKRLGLDITQKLWDRLGVRGPHLMADVRHFSGGNQQKVVLGKWLATRPKLLLLDDPTKGVDVGAKEEIHAIMRELCSSGLSIVMSSSELPELLQICDRITVLREGQAVSGYNAKTATQEEILASAFGAQA